MTLQTGSSGNNINIEETKKIRVLDLSLDRQQQILDKLDEIENVINTTLFNLRDICYFLGTKNVKTLEFTSVGFNQTSWNQAKLCK